MSLGWSPWKKPRNKDHALAKFDENVYDLYAICNHHGQDLQSGHYTAFCRNPYNAQWYCFDDTRVDEVNETNLVTSAAYMLFYQRRGLMNGSGGSSSAASTSSTGSGVDHWVSKMPPFSYSPQKEGRDEDRSVEEKNLSNNFNRRLCRNYASLQPSKRTVATETESRGHCSDDEDTGKAGWVG